MSGKYAMRKLCSTMTYAAMIKVDEIILSLNGVILRRAEAVTHDTAFV